MPHDSTPLFDQAEPPKKKPTKKPAKKRAPAKSRFRIVHEKGAEHFRPIELPEMTLEDARFRLDQEQNHANATSIGEGMSLEKITPIPLTAEQVQARQEREEHRAKDAEIERKHREEREKISEEYRRRNAEFRRLRSEGVSYEEAMKISKAGQFKTWPF